MDLRVATYNIRRGGHRRAGRIGDVLAELEPDIAVLQEATSTRVVDEVADRLGALVAERRRGWSVALVARTPIGPTRWHALGRGRTMLEAEVPDHDLRIIGVHLSAGMSSSFERRREREIDNLLGVAREGPYRSRTLVAGDLNAIAPGDRLAVASLPRWIRVLAHLDGGIPVTAMRRILEAGFIDLYRARHPEELGATMPAWAPVARLDYLLATPALAARASGCSVGGAALPAMLAASDHLPLIVDFGRAGSDPAPGTGDDEDGGGQGSDQQDHHPEAPAVL